jgi:hypothetical protein
MNISYIFDLTLSSEFGEKALLIIIPSIFTAGLTYLVSRRKNLADTTSVWQKMYLDLIGTLEVIRDKTEIVENELEDAQRKLRSCLRSKDGCAELAAEINGIFDKTEAALKDLSEHAPLLKEVRQVKSKIIKVQS